MNNRQRERKNKSNGTLGIAVVAVLALLEFVGSGAAGITSLIVVLLLLGVGGFAIAYLLGKKMKGAKTGSVYHAERGREMAKRMFMREAMDEEAVKCAHPRGREKYIHQLDNFLANGLIDKSEYRVLKERYEKISIPENMC